MRATFPRIPLSQIECPTLPIFRSGQQIVSCDDGDLSATVDLPAGLSIEGSSLILAAGQFTSHFGLNAANEAALNYVTEFFNDGIASGSLVCIGDPPQVANICGWWKADSFSLADGTPVGGTGVEWQDQGVGNKDAVQAVAGARPLFKTNIFGTRPAIRFDGVDDALTFSPDFTFTGGSDEFTIVAVYKHNSASDGILLGFQGLSYQMLSRASVNTMRAYDLAILYDSAALASSPSVVRSVAFRNKPFAANEMFRENKTNRGPLTQSNIGFRFDTIGSTNGALFLNGDIGEILVYCATLTDGELDTLYDDYLKPRYPALPS